MHLLLWVVIILSIWILPYMGIYYFLQKKFYLPAFKYAKVPRKKFEDIPVVLALYGGKWNVFSKSKKSEFFEEKGIKLMDKYCGYAWILYSLHLVFAITFIFLLVYFVN